MVIWGQNNAQNTLSFTLKRVTLIALQPEVSTIKLEFNKVIEAGNAIGQGAVDTSIWLNYSVAIAKADPLKNVSVSLDKLIPGVDIVLQAQNAIPATGGALGKPVPQVVIGMTPVVVITGIGGAYTGKGQGSGHNLKYSLQVNDYSKLVTTPNEIVTITYTISN